MKQKEIEQNNEAFFKENSKAFIKLPSQLYKMLETAKDKDIGTIKFIPKTKEISMTVKNGLETSDYNIEFVNNDKPTILFTESVTQKPPDSQTQKSEFELELIGLVKFKGNSLKGKNEKIEFKATTDTGKKTQKYDQMGIRGRYNNDQVTDNDWGRRERAARDVRREKQDKEVLESKIFDLFKKSARYKFTELQAETNEPKNSLDEALKALCETETVEGRKYFVLKDIYRFGSVPDQNYAGATPSKKVKKD